MQLLVVLFVKKTLMQLPMVLLDLKQLLGVHLDLMQQAVLEQIGY